LRHPRLVSAGLALALALLAAAPVRGAGANEFASPPPNLLYQLQKQNLAHPWLRVTVDSARLDLRAERIDEAGLRGLQSRSSDSPPPGLIEWRSIGRIDEVVTLAHRGKVLGFIVGGAIGAGLGNTIGSSIRTPTGVGQGYGGGDLSSGGQQGGPGALLGLALFGGLGAWQGGRWGERRAHERTWYVATPAVAHGEGALPGVGEKRSADTNPDSLTTPRPPPEVLRSSPSSGLSPSPRVLRACARIGRDDLIRVRGDFGEFQGFAAVVGPEGMEGLRVRSDRGRPSIPPVPAGRVTWDRIDKVDKRGHGWRQGAIVGGLLLGALGGWAGYQEATYGLLEAHGPDPPLEVVGITVGGFAYGAAVGAVLGAGVGWLFPAWHRVYVRPKAADTGR